MFQRLRRGSHERAAALLVVAWVASSAAASGVGCSDDAASPAASASGGAAGSDAGAGGDDGQSGQAGSSTNGGSSGKGGSSTDGGSSGKGGAAGKGGTAGKGGSAGTGGVAGSGQSGSGAGGKAGEAAAGGGGASAGASGSGGAGGAITFKDSYPIQGEFPEGGIYDPVGRAFYVGSLKDGRVRRIDAATGQETTFFTETAPGKWWTLGLDVDVQNRRLWVCAMDDKSPLPRAGHVWGFDLVTGARLAAYPLEPAQADGSCTDVAVTKNGDVYVADREAGTIYRASVTAPPVVFASDPLLDGDLAGLNGLSVLPDESALLAVVYRPARLVRIDLASKQTIQVDVTGPFNDPSALAGADGLALRDGNAYVAFSNRFIRVVPTDATWQHGTASAIDDVPQNLTDVVATPDGLYLLNGQSITFALGATPNAFALTRFTDTFLGTFSKPGFASASSDGGRERPAQRPACNKED